MFHRFSNAHVHVCGTCEHVTLILEGKKYKRCPRSKSKEVAVPVGRKYRVLNRSATAKHHQVKPKIRSVKYSKLHAKANSEFHLGMKHLKPLEGHTALSIECFVTLCNYVIRA